MGECSVNRRMIWAYEERSLRRNVLENFATTNIGSLFRLCLLPVAINLQYRVQSALLGRICLIPWIGDAYFDVWIELLDSSRITPSGVSCPCFNKALENGLYQGHFNDVPLNGIETNGGILGNVLWFTVFIHWAWNPKRQTVGATVVVKESANSFAKGSAKKSARITVHD